MIAKEYPSQKRLKELKKKEDAAKKYFEAKKAYHKIKEVV